MAVIASLSGIGLKPGISKNRRYYPTTMVARAVERAQARLADPDGRPITMRISHIRPEDANYAPVTAIAGAVRKLAVETDGSMSFDGDLYDTASGRDVLALTDTRRGQRPALRNVSIRGRWVGPTRVEMVDGVPCETADDLEIDGIDFTHLPGVDGARIERVSGPGPAETAEEAALIYESCEETTVTETVNDSPVEVPYADLGYLPDGQRRWPLDTAGHARSAWRALAESETAHQYTAAQLKRAKGRVEKALRGFGITTRRGIGESAVLVQQGEVTEGFGMPEEYTTPGSFRVVLDNGTVCVTVASCCIDPHDLSRLGTAAMTGAVNALLTMDPDDDGDIDVPGAPYQDSDNDLAAETAPAEAAPAEPDSAQETDPAEPAGDAAPGQTAEPDTTTDTAATEDAATESEDAAMADETETTAAEPTPAAAGTVTLTPEALAGLVTAAATAAVQAMRGAAPAESAAPVGTGVAEAAPAPSAPAEPAPAPAAAETTESLDEKVDRLVSARLTQAVQTAVASGRVAAPRKGFVGRVDESGQLSAVGEPGGSTELNDHGLPKQWAGDKAAHQLVGSERSHLSAALMQHVLGNRI